MILLYVFSLILIFKIGRTKPMNLNEVYTVYKKKVFAKASELNVPPSIILALIHRESAGVPHAIGTSGEIGLGQIMKGALTDYNTNHKGLFETFELTDMFDIDQNLEVSIWYLSYLKNRFFHSWELSLRAYNAGIGNIRKDQSISENYSSAILKNAKILQEKHNIL